jgi:D-alanyl-D-alanine carboxypeptidase (penicillin-binding protein 5/6)
MPTHTARRTAAAAVACSLALAAGGPATAAASTHGASHRSSVGGALLAGRGVAVDPHAPPLPKGLTSSAWLVADLTTGQVLAAKDAHGEFLPASTLKTLTAATLLPRLDPKRMWRATDRDARVDGTRVGMVPGTRYPLSKLFLAMLVMSANDAADGLAEANGGLHRTVREMNAEAARLHADDTHADNPSGLDGTGEHTSVYDLALIARHDFADPAFRRYVQTVDTSFPAPHGKHFMVYTHNELLTSYPGDIGGKNGYTVAADGSYMGAATRHGQTILVTLLHAYPYFWPEARSLLDWGFQAAGRVTPVGRLVQPQRPHAIGPATVPGSPVAATLPAGDASGGGGGPTAVELSLLAVTVAGAGVLLARRRAVRRRSTRLRLPPV